MRELCNDAPATVGFARRCNEGGESQVWTKNITFYQTVLTKYNIQPHEHNVDIYDKVYFNSVSVKWLPNDDAS